MGIQESVKERLINIIKFEGINQKFIAQKVGIAESSLSKYKNGSYDLPHFELNMLDEFLQTKGY